MRTAKILLALLSLTLATFAASVTESVTIQSSTGAVLNSSVVNFTTNKLQIGGTAIPAPGAIVVTSGSYANPSWVTSLAWGKLTSTPTTIAGYGITDPIVLTSGTYSDPAWLTALSWSKLTSTPTTLAGYGITDPVVKTSDTGTVTNTMLAGSIANSKLANSSVTIGGASVALGASIGTGMITGLTADGAPDGAADFVMTYDASAGALKKVMLNDLPGGGGGGTAIDLAGIAWVETAANGGSDGTGTVGDPSKPYETMDAAFADGARVFMLGPGTFAGISSVSAATTISLMGQGAEKTTVTSIATGNPNYSLTVRDLGLQTLTITTLSNAGTSAIPTAGTLNAYSLKIGTLDASGNGLLSAGNGGNVTLDHCAVDTLNAFGATPDASLTQVNGGLGGNVTATDCNFTTINLYGGSGAASDESQDAPGGGQGGSFALTRCTVDTVNGSGGTGGSASGFNGGYGAQAAGGTLTHSTVLNLSINGGSGGTGFSGQQNGGQGGYVTGVHAHVTTGDFAGGSGGTNGNDGGVDGYQFTIATGNFIGSGTGSASGKFICIGTITGGGSPAIAANGYYINGSGSW